MRRIALIGYGEVGKILAEDLRARDLEVHAWDRDLDAPRGDAMRSHAALHGVALGASAAAAVSGADLVVSVVTASQTVNAAADCAPGLRADAFFLDLNSASPAARHYGVEDAVLVSPRETFPGIHWESQASYFFQRTIEHGRRRSEEMREAARSVTGAGLEPLSASAAAERQGWMADLADAGCFGAREDVGYARSADWRVEADRILGRTPGTR
ncbi:MULTISPECIES: DUF1932 domain-containing protein [unclassified Luteimonas]